MLDPFTRQQINSACLATVGYAPQTHTLEIRFRSGALYWYAAVPARLYSRLLAAPSKGRFFAGQIKGRYPYVRLAGPRKK